MKPSINVGTLGHTTHGKTTLTAAICTVLAKTYGGATYGFASINNAPKETVKGITINVSRVEYQTPTRRYLHTDCVKHLDCVKNLIAGSTIMDAAILVVAATDGIMPETQEQVRLCRQVGVPRLIVFLNKCDMIRDEEMLELQEMEIRELLSEYGFPGDDVPVIRGSALKALNAEKQWEDKIIELTTALDNYIPQPEPTEAKPFLLQVEDAFIDGRGTVITGLMEQGILKVSDKAEIVGIKATRATTCTSMEILGQVRNEARPGERVSVVLQGIEQDAVQRGQVLAKPGSITANSQFEAIVYILSEDEGGRHTPFFKDYRPQFSLRTTDMTGDIKLPDGVEMVMPGSHLTMGVKLIAPVAMKPRLRFIIREGSLTVGAGVVAKIIQ